MLGLMIILAVLGFKISRDIIGRPDDFKGAVDYLAMSYTGQEKAEIRAVIKQRDWKAENHHSLGLDARNRLREGRFDWSDAVLDNYWDDVLRKAIR
tara:strand:+ start:642 stop:929 length:288 start_codon:yes stop_codon:yes gene_type:complete